MCIPVVCIHLWSHRVVRAAQTHTLQGVSLVQGIRGDQFCLVAVVDKHGVRTGEWMYVRYCGGCRRGEPVHKFRAGKAQCTRCLERLALRGPREERAERDLPEGYVRWATFDKPLIRGDPVAPGFCKAKDCPREVSRIGDGPRDETRPLPFCEAHMEV